MGSNMRHKKSYELVEAAIGRAAEGLALAREIEAALVDFQVPELLWR